MEPLGVKHLGLTKLLANAEKEVQKLKNDAGHTGEGGQPQYNESQKIVYELYFANKPNETTTVIYKDLNLTNFLIKNKIFTKFCRKTCQM